jgi:hypothetical protein
MKETQLLRRDGPRPAHGTRTAALIRRFACGILIEIAAVALLIGIVLFISCLGW